MNNRYPVVEDLVPLVEMDDVAEIERRGYKLEEMATLRF